MADVRSMLKNERTARRIHHKYASYSTAGTLRCTVCHLQLKSESLWDGHLRSTGHIIRTQKAQEPQEETPADDGNRKKRKASDGVDENVDTTRKRTKSSDPSLPAGVFDPGPAEVVEGPTTKVPSPTNELQMKSPSRLATPLEPTQELPSRLDEDVDEDEWAAFEADIAAADPKPQLSMGDGEGVISAPAMTTAELKKREDEEDFKRRKHRLEAEAEGDKEDAARKLEEGFEEMESLEQRVRRLREKREALRKDHTVAPREAPAAKINNLEDEEEQEEEEEEDDDDEWDGFRMKR